MNRKSLLSRTGFLTTAILCASLVGQVRPSLGGPGDTIVTHTAAQFGTPEAPTVDVVPDDLKVASRTGAFETSIPIVVPPGRLGQQPNLALNYSSQGAVYGGIAAGWSLDLPMIQVDYSDGKRIANHSGTVERRWTSSLAGGHRLVPVTETSVQPRSGEHGPYRAIYDDSYTRYEFQDTGVWIARSVDGGTMFFGEVANILDSSTQAPILPADLPDRAPLTHTEDKFGNRVDYYYQAGVSYGRVIDLLPSRIEYTKNAAVTGNALDHHAEVEFTWVAATQCGSQTTVPVGATLDYRSGRPRYSGRSKLATIQTHVAVGSSLQVARSYFLGYEESCTDFGGAVRYLTTINQSAPAVSGDASAYIWLPPKTFTYGPTAPTYGAPEPLNIVTGQSPTNAGSSLSWGRRSSIDTGNADEPRSWQAVQSKLIDLDGDGYLDRIHMDQAHLIEDQHSCKFSFEAGGQNATGPHIGAEGATMFSLPALIGVGKTDGNYREEYCSLAGQVTFVQNKSPPSNPISCPSDPEHSGNVLSYRFMDVDADGRPDLVTGLSFDPWFYSPYDDYDNWAGILEQVAFAETDPKEDDPNTRGSHLISELLPPDALVCEGREYCEFNSGAVPAIQQMIVDGESWSGFYDIERACRTGETDTGCVSALIIDDSGSGSGSCDDLDQCCNFDFGTGVGTVDNSCCAAEFSESCVPVSKCEMPACSSMPAHCQEIACGTSDIPGDDDNLPDGDPGNPEGDQTGPGGACNQCGNCDNGSGYPLVECPSDRNDNCPASSNVRHTLLSKNRKILVWYRNVGADLGFFDLSDRRIMRSPIPLDPDLQGGPPSVTGAALVGGNSSGAGPIGRSYAFIDINGDGFVDTVNPGTDPNGDFWQVHLGDGEGRFNGDPLTTAPYLWPVPKGARPSRNVTNPWDFGTSYQVRSYSTSQLADVNGDGLVDLLWWDQDNDLKMRVLLNNGAGFTYTSTLSNSPALNGETAPTTTSSVYDDVSLGTDSYQYANRLVDGLGASNIRLVDWDSDGRADLVVNHTLAPDPVISGTHDIVAPPWEYTLPSTPRLYVNGGFAPFHAVQNLPDSDVVGNDTVFWDSEWHVRSDFVDVTGDGVPEKVYYDQAASSWMMKKVSLDSGAPRLLKTIDNGIGVTRQITYAPHNDPAVAAKSQTGAGMPHHIWVVDNVQATDLIGDSSAIQEVRYGDPVWNQENHPLWNADESGRYGFRGFNSIETSDLHLRGETSGFAVTEDVYDYSVDWSGRLSQKTTYVDGFPTHSGGDLVASIQSTSWAEYSVLGGESLSFQSESSTTRICENATGAFLQENVCAGSVVTSAERMRYSAHEDPADASAVVLHALKDATTTPFVGGDLSWLEPGVRADLFRYDLRYSADRYELMKRSEYRTFDNNLSMASSTQFYPELSYLYNARTVVELAPGVRAESYTTRDVGTGNITDFEKPLQVSAGPGKVPTGVDTTFTFSGFHVYPTSEINELGHTTTFESDIGTGLTTRTEGPNVISCGTSTGPEGSRSVFDGFGRPVDVYVFGCTTPSTYGEYLSAHYDYQDYDQGTSAPSSVMTTTYLDYAATVGVETQSYFDGFGRVVRVRDVVDQGNANIHYEYDLRGNLSKLSTVNPSGYDDSDRSHYAFKYDVLNRSIGMRVPAPDGSVADPEAINWDDYVGTNTTYGFDGTYTTTTTEEWVLDGGPRSKTTTFKDMFGRLMEVHETLNDGVSVASTSYAYDQNDNLNFILDADGIQTSMEHDMASRRTKIVRGTREWKFEYDFNNNLILATAPVPAGALEVSYQTSYAYDALDRKTSDAPAPRNLSAADQDLLGATNLIEYAYDIGHNAIGRLSTVYGGGYYQRDYVYDGAGLVAQEYFSYDITSASGGSIGGEVNDQRTRSFTYNAAGSVTNLITSDGFNLDYTYNVAGQQDRLTWIWDDIATLGRNHAGLPEYSTRGTSGGPIQTWEYDQLGRVTDLNLLDPNWSDGGLREQMTYFDSNELASQSIWRAQGEYSTDWIFAYDYDSRHQLTGASDSFGNYAALFEYTGAGRISSAFVEGIASAPLLLDRDVDYNYGDHTSVDGHAVEALTQAGAPYASYSYDLSGNVVKRTEEAPSASWNFVYDGLDRQRIVSGPDGRDEIYYYDENGQRFLAVERNSLDFVNRSKHWFGDSEYWFETNGYIEKAMTHFSIGGQIVARADNENSQAQFEYSYHNGLGHLIGVTDMDGIVLTSFVYGPFGEILGQSGETSTHLRRFNGKEADQLSRLNYYGYRYYDPLSLMWTQADPLFRFVPDLAYDEPRLMSLYAFSMNNPVRYTDPDGRYPTDLCTNCAGKGGWIQGKRRTENAIESAYMDDMLASTGGAGAAAATVQSAKRTTKTLAKSVSRPAGNASPSLQSAVRVRLKEINGRMRKVVEVVVEKVSSANKKSGSYTNTHASGKKYHGKGDRKRSQKSARRIAKENDDPHTATDFTDAPNEREGFKQESRRLDGDQGGAQSTDNYNIKESPGKKMRQDDGEVD